MKIVGIPYGNMNTATTRIRFHSFLDALPEGHEWSVCDGDPHGDILYIQKKADEDAFRMVEKAQRHGMKVVYDLDDEIKTEPGKWRDRMVRLVDMVTTDMPEWAEKLTSHGAKIVRVVPDCVDYHGQYEPYGVREEAKSVVTFGNTPSVLAAVDYIDYLHLPFQTTYITSRPQSDFTRAQFKEWKLDGFIKELTIHDWCFLAQPFGGKTKSNNRLLVCMALGIPTLVTDSPAFSQTMERVGYPSLIVRNSDDVVIKLCAYSDPNIRRSISCAFQSVALDYRPEASAIKLLAVFNEILGG